ncbi:hypothetical protein UFOVP1506_18 [uncultured Caudovirales phage]|uniref:Uncharacterized protein n=1 Tax=uncultured Caudovirales phage TaxID=2100421 RepID=A0A6J5Q9U3_9CAUD|nr:hypothetical protein UFOVP292_18 [uncultured Caudovirales phage]CAB4149448.1 hypothetical protein UFOVP559_10 [uncultured Caudovirales phage]CAB4168319.1 hypothetical protein UFOVP880_5 [uncultured Caudovirales phage]CAB4180292.1 hypothetical protein UFOVP1055_17 [uncultured Caudovirales phage]CAB4194994.1 hypothetical protein UFOVP1270_17 [uncultured Caudovirales phage]
MATSTYLSNPGVMVNSVSLTDQCTAATVTNMAEALESTAFGSTSRVFVSGLYNQEITLDLYMSYAATETYATLAALVGTTTTVKVSNTVAGLTTASATEPRFELVGAYLESLPVINATMGELSTISIIFKGGVLSTIVS